MDASNYMDKQIMDLSWSKISNSNPDLIDLMKPLPINDGTDEKAPGDVMKEESHRSYEFQPIPSVGLLSRSSDSPPTGGGGGGAPRAWNSATSKSNYSPARSYGYLGSIEPDKGKLEEAQNVNDAALLSDIDRTMKRYTDNLLHAIDGLSAHLSQLETRTRQLEHFVDDLKVSIGNNYGSTDEKTRHIENIILEVKSCVQDLKDKQEIMNTKIQLEKLQMSKVDQTPETHNAARFDPPEQSSPAQESYQQFPVSSLQSLPAISPNAPPPMQQMPNHYPPTSFAAVPQRDTCLPPAGPTQEVPSHQYPLTPGSVPGVPQRDTYLPPAGPTQEVPPAHQQHPQTHVPPPGVHQQYQSYPQQLSQQHIAVNAPPPQLQPPMTHHSEAPQNYPFNQPSHQFYNAPPSYANDSLASRSSSGFSSSAYIPPTGPSEAYAYSGPSSNYGKNPAIKPRPHSSGSGGNYPQQAIPTASPVGGGSGAGGSGNRVPIDDVVDKVTNMGFSREQVNATVRKLTENGQRVDLNIVLDKLMNDGEVQPPRGWFRG